MRYLGVAVALLAIIAPEGMCANETLGPVSVIVSADGSRVCVAEYAARRVAFFEAASGKELFSVELAEGPWGLALSPDGTRVYATGAAAAGKVYAIDIPSKNVALTINAGHTPSSVAVSPDGATLYVCNRFDNSVGVYDAASGAALAAG
ncbi:MAG: YncE family protein, partial [Candidatus Hydrogenedentes bacterium]|nr:YncE family protein [Candidatus Hydrogenedentota bacterium]